MFVEHTLLTELQPQLQNYLPREKENKSRLMVKIQTVGSSSPTPIQRSRQHIYLFMDHFSHSVGRPAFCVYHASPAWSSPTWQSLDIPVSSNTSRGQPPPSMISGCVLMPTLELLGIHLFTCIFLDESPKCRDRLAHLCTLYTCSTVHAD